jgi:membrane-associated protein
MDGLIHEFLRLFTELDKFLADFVRDHGTLTYGLLFAIVFCETGLVVLPFLPGDSLLFAAGAIAVRGIGIDPWTTAAVLFIAAVLGDAVNYHIGRWIGPPAFSGRFRWLRQDHLLRTQKFFERYGGRAVVLARFVPIVRTFAPFVAGVGAMRYRRFVAFNVLGAGLWVAIAFGGGCFFGNIPWVKRNFSVVVIGIIIVSVLPLVWEWWAHRRVLKTREHSV